LSDKEPSQAFDIIITNPPYCRKYEFVEKCIRLKKPFALLLPMSSVFTMKWFKKFENVKFLFQAIVPKCSFLHEGKQVVIGDIDVVLGYMGIFQI
jgi:DNA modification methylase